MRFASTGPEGGDPDSLNVEVDNNGFATVTLCQPGEWAARTI